MTIASLEYIDDVMDRVIEAKGQNITETDKDREAAAIKARKIIGGFRVKDRDAEKQELDALIKGRIYAIDVFKADRKGVREKLKNNGIEPLAIIPKKIWHQIVRKTGMYMIVPDNKGQISVKSGAFAGIPEKVVGGMTHNELLAKLMPIQCSYESGPKLTVVLPDPPDDVADILLKASGLRLMVAAVPEAIQFAENRASIFRQGTYSAKDLWAREQGYDDYKDWIKRDPIIYIEHGSARAIIAQFGDFPIEKEVVDEVVKTDGWLSDNVATETQSVLSAADNAYGVSLLGGEYPDQITQMQEAMRQQR